MCRYLWLSQASQLPQVAVFQIAPQRPSIFTHRDGGNPKVL